MIFDAMFAFYEVVSKSVDEQLSKNAMFELGVKVLASHNMWFRSLLGNAGRFTFKGRGEGVYSVTHTS